MGPASASKARTWNSLSVYRRQRGQRNRTRQVTQFHSSDTTLRDTSCRISSFAPQVQLVEGAIDSFYEEKRARGRVARAILSRLLISGSG